MAKAEYVDQKYKDFPTTDIRNGGEFKGMMVEGVVTLRAQGGQLRQSFAGSLLQLPAGGLGQHEHGQTQPGQRERHLGDEDPAPPDRRERDRGRPRQQDQHAGDPPAAKVPDQEVSEHRRGERVRELHALAFPYPLRRLAP